ncbi:MAG TPA: toll/interleukin-1 receptor domain-containing protein [Ktedonobacteraceae bacterium]|nr:toll/interleukin-1 receptor domain-containing protein [Ktedonobacteraceae bacterium]
MANPIHVFLSYAPHDAKLANEFTKYLSALQRQGLITVWDSNRLAPGADWQGELERHLATAQIILLLISADFLASDIFLEIIDRAMQKSRMQKARVVPILLRSAAWRESPLGSLLPLPRNGTPVTNWRNKDRAFLEIAHEIKQLIETLLKQPVLQTPLAPSTALSAEEKTILYDKLEQVKNSLHESYAYMQGYESLIRISSDPAEKDGARRAAEKQRILARYFFNDYVQIADRLGVIVPAEVAQMSPFIDDNGTQPAL